MKRKKLNPIHIPFLTLALATAILTASIAGLPTREPISLGVMRVRI